MTAHRGADVVAAAFEEYGAEYVFGNPGTTELPVLRSVGESDVEYVQALHEDVAVGMAAGYACTRRYHAHDDPDVTPVGVANLHITPGLAHGIANMYAASWAGAPLVVTAGNHERDFRAQEPILSGDLLGLVESVTKWQAEVLSAESLPTLLRRAFREALSPPQGPVFLALPQDVMLEETDVDVEPLGDVPRPGPGDPDAISRAADLLVEAEAPAIVLGDGVARSPGGIEATVRLAEATGARVHSEIQTSETNFPSTHPQWVAPIPPPEDLARGMMDTDTVAFVGTISNTTVLKNEEPIVDPDTTGIHVGPDAHQVGKNYPTDAAVVGETAAATEAIAAAVEGRIDDATVEDRLGAVEATKEAIEPIVDAMRGEVDSDDPRCSKGALVEAVHDVQPEAFVVDEGITAKYVLLTRWPFQRQDFLSSKSGGLGFGLPASVGVALAQEQVADGRPVVAHIGDGSYQYYPQTIQAAARAGVDLTVVVPNNKGYHILENNADTLMGEGAQEEVPGLDLGPVVDIPTSAESYGARGHRVESPEDLESTVSTALGNDGVDVVDVLVHD